MLTPFDWVSNSSAARPIFAGAGEDYIVNVSLEKTIFQIANKFCKIYFG
jgi:hypothetical protein